MASPALYRGRKFDVRVLVAVRSFAPALQALTWRTVYVRAANRAYTASPAALGDFQTQFTSMRQARRRFGHAWLHLSADFVASPMPFLFFVRAALRRRR